MNVYDNLAALAADEGRELGVSSWIDVTQERIDLFAEATGDRQWIHVDPARAQAELGMGTIAHGYLTMALIPRFMQEILSIRSVTRTINYGANKVRFTAIVPAGARIRGRITLARAVLSPGSLRTISTVTAECEGLDKPVLVADIITLFYE